MTVLSCSNNENVRNDDNLLNYLESKTYETGAVIACAASDENTNDVLVFYYPEDGAIDIKLYESIDTDFSTGILESLIEISHLRNGLLLPMNSMEV